METVVKTSGQPLPFEPAPAAPADWPTVLGLGPTTGGHNPALSTGDFFCDEVASGGWRCTTKPGAAGVSGPLTLFSCGTGAAGQFGGTFAVQSGASIGGGAGGSMLLGSASATEGASFAVNAGSGGGNAGVASGDIRFGTQAPGPGGLQGDFAVTGPGACLGVQARLTLPANVLNTMGGYWGQIQGPSSVPIYRDNTGADRQLQYLLEESFQAFASNTFTVATTPDTNFHPTPGAAFGTSSGGTSFVLGAADCIATYFGTVTKKFLVRVVVATVATVGAGDTEFTGCVAVNGDVLGTAGGTQLANGEVNVNHTIAVIDGVIQRGVFERVVTLSTGDTVQPAIARFAGTAVDINGDWMTMTIQEVN